MDDEGKLVSMVLEANENVRYACICNENGEVLWNSRRNEIESIMSLEDTKTSLKNAVEHWKDREAIEAKIGRGRYSVTDYEKLKRVTVPLKNNHLLYVHIEGHKPAYIEDIMKIVNWVDEHPS